jgi:hypothetical protein
MKKKVAKVVFSVAGTVMLTACACMFSFSGLPQTSQPEAGRIYPLRVSKGGSVVYVSHKEEIQYEVSLGLFALSILVAAVTDYYFDPFDRRKWVKPLAGYRSEKDC